MGKLQELKRYFGPWAIVGFASILGCAWQYALITTVFSLPNGGPAGATYMFLACCLGLMLATLSLAEMCKTGSCYPFSLPDQITSFHGAYRWRPVSLDL